MGRLAHAWNAFMNPDRSTQDPFKMELRTSTPTVQMPYRYQVQSNIIDTIFNQISVDVAKVSIRHIRCDYDKTYLEDLETGFNQCLTVSPNIDQTPRAFMQDLCLTLLEEGAAAIVPQTSPIVQWIRTHTTSTRCGSARFASSRLRQLLQTSTTREPVTANQ